MQVKCMRVVSVLHKELKLLLSFVTYCVMDLNRKTAYESIRWRKKWYSNKSSLLFKTVNKQSLLFNNAQHSAVCKPDKLCQQITVNTSTQIHYFRANKSTLPTVCATYNILRCLFNARQSGGKVKRCEGISCRTYWPRADHKWTILFL